MYVALGHNSIMVTHYSRRVPYDVPTTSRSLFRSTRGAFILIFGSFLVVCCDLILATIRPAECPVAPSIELSLKLTLTTLILLIIIP